jgi:malonyl CoA-acyl carrier protein transacylase
LGAADELIGALTKEHGVVVANRNAPGQVVLAGLLTRLATARERAREQGARAVMLDVAGAFHSPAMSAVVESFRRALDRVEFRPPAIPVISGSTGKPFADLRSELAAAIARPVRWQAAMLALARAGADTFVDFGPGTVLARLVRRNLPDARVLDLGKPGARSLESSGVV